MPSPTETVQLMYAAFGRGDVPGLLEHVTDDIEWTFAGSIALPYLGTFRGKAALMQWFGLVAEADAIQTFEPHEFVVGADHVTVLGWEGTQASPGGGVSKTNWVHVMRLRDGKVSRFYGMFDTAAVARARAGIAAPAAPR